VGPLPAASVGVRPDGRAAARCTGGIPAAEPLFAGAGVDGSLPSDGRAVARWAGGAVDVEPSPGVVAAGSPLAGCAGEPDGRVAARWTGGVPGAVPLSAGAGVEGLPLADGRAVARWTGVVLSLGAVAAGLLPPGCAVPRPAGASVGAGPDGCTAVRWTGGVPGAEP
ncbi:hypothetical protein GTY88_13540, partial [Streptomyces sp. SID5926]|nr:hypothetical protein [Streptomyces sp. SID5926]